MYYSRTILYFFKAKLPLTNEVYIYIIFSLCYCYIHTAEFKHIYIYMYVSVLLNRSDALMGICTNMIFYINIIRKLQSFFPLPCRSTSSSSLLCHEKPYSKLHFSHSAHRASKQVFDLSLLVVNGFTRISLCSSHRRADDLGDSVFSAAKCCQSFLFAPLLLREGDYKKPCLLPPSLS